MEGGWSGFIGGYASRESQRPVRPAGQVFLKRATVIGPLVFDVSIRQVSYEYRLDHQTVADFWVDLRGWMWRRQLLLE